eukprot:CAMPEP_0194746966 /NCGR_PEP_ID=MMETSP0323_2-20130528/1045_1 /TAXON_ID=2866 ORGANISM="Crypthecodinium cohnii, Strain Seligo" /NCGR_SAMPLE_ID=MMETSP0323_2 /ASSEMBLY_ACC=CAM_ASM_000346 /LENGTH=39 /DNA_ID= /DNA_START= /DNA_END= /DNA_ORIENTATION=
MKVTMKEPIDVHVLEGKIGPSHWRFGLEEEKKVGRMDEQ